MIRWLDPDEPTEPDTDTDDDRVGWADPGGHLSVWSGVYAALGEFGWAPDQVNQMECWQAAQFLGHGPPDDDTTYRLVLRGARMIAHRGEDDDPGDPSQQAQVSVSERADLLNPARGADRPVTRMRPVPPDP